MAIDKQTRVCTRGWTQIGKGPPRNQSASSYMLLLLPCCHTNVCNKHSQTHFWTIRQIFVTLWVHCWARNTVGFTAASKTVSISYLRCWACLDVSTIGQLHQHGAVTRAGTCFRHAATIPFHSAIIHIWQQTCMFDCPCRQRFRQD